MTDCHYHRPTTLDEAFQLAADAESACFIAGGTELYGRMHQGQKPWPPTLISLRSVGEVTRIERRGERLCIGAAVPLCEIAAHPGVAGDFPALVQAIGRLGSRQIRNVATMGGNLCNASPCADTAPPLLVYGASVELRDARGARELPLEDFFRGPGETALRAGELLTAIRLDPPPAGARATFLRKGRVAMDLAMASVAVYVELEGERCTKARLAAGSVAPVPKRLAAVERLLEGRALSAELLREAREAARAEIAPISDLRASADYRSQLIGVFIERALEKLLGVPVGGR